MRQTAGLATPGSAARQCGQGTAWPQFMFVGAGPRACPRWAAARAAPTTCGRDARAPKGEGSQGPPLQPTTWWFGHPWERRTPVRPRNRVASIHVRRGRPPCLPEMGGRKGRPYNMGLCRGTSPGRRACPRWAAARAAPTTLHMVVWPPLGAPCRDARRAACAISHKSLQDKVWSVVLLGLIPCNGYFKRPVGTAGQWRGNLFRRGADSVQCVQSEPI